MAPALRTEDIARAVVAHLDMYLRTHLDVVEARWAGVDPMALPSPVDVTYGFEEIVLRMAPTDFPRVAVLAAPVRPSGTQGDQRFAQVTHTLVVEWIVTGVGSAAATVLSWRYGEALVACLSTATSFAGFSPQGLIPEVQAGQAMRHAGGSMNSASTMTSTSLLVPYIAGGVLTYGLQGRYVA